MKVDKRHLELQVLAVQLNTQVLEFVTEHDLTCEETLWVLNHVHHRQVDFILGAMAETDPPEGGTST